MSAGVQDLPLISTDGSFSKCASLSMSPPPFREEVMAERRSSTCSLDVPRATSTLLEASRFFHVGEAWRSAADFEVLIRVVI